MPLSFTPGPLDSAAVGFPDFDDGSQEKSFQRLSLSVLGEGEWEEDPDAEIEQEEADPGSSGPETKRILDAAFESIRGVAPFASYLCILAGRSTGVHPACVLVALLALCAGAAPELRVGMTSHWQQECTLWVMFTAGSGYGKRGLGEWIRSLCHRFEALNSKDVPGGGRQPRPWLIQSTSGLTDILATIARQWRASKYREV